MLPEPIALIAARRATPTPQPDMGEQVANDLIDKAGSAIETASGYLDLLPTVVSRLLMTFLVLIIGLIAIKLGKLLITAVARLIGKKSDYAAKRSETARSFITSIFSYIMFFIMATVILWLFNVSMTSILAAAGVVGIGLAFGAQTLVKDLLSGLFIWGERSIGIGDLVNINDMEGTVESISIRTTSIRNYNGNVITIPNGDIRAITNMSHGFKRAIVTIPCPYEESQERLVAMVREEMETAAQEVDGIENVPDVMSIVSFDKLAVQLQVAVVCPVGEHWRIEREIRTRIKARFDREGIVMPHYPLPDSEGR